MAAKASGKGLLLRLTAGIAVMALCVFGLWLLDRWMAEPRLVTGSGWIVVLVFRNLLTLIALVKIAWILGMAILAGVAVKHWAALLVVPATFWLSVGVLLWVEQNPGIPWQSILPWNVTTQAGQDLLSMLALVVAGSVIGVLGGYSLSRSQKAVARQA